MITCFMQTNIALQVFHNHIHVVYIKQSCNFKTVHFVGYVRYRRLQHVAIQTGTCKIRYISNVTHVYGITKFRHNRNMQECKYMLGA